MHCLFLFRSGRWFQVEANIAKEIWTPDINFNKLIDQSPIVLAGKSRRKYEFWLKMSDSEVESKLYQSFKVKFACEYHFEYFPFDSHLCNLDYGLEMNSNFSTLMLPIKILGKDTKATLLKKGEYVDIPNNHLPYEFSLTIGDNFLDYNYEFYSPYSSLVIKAHRTQLGSLIGGYYGPTTIFSMLSMISYLINAEVVKLLVYEKLKHNL